MVSVALCVLLKPRPSPPLPVHDTRVATDLSLRCLRGYAEVDVEEASDGVEEAGADGGRAVTSRTRVAGVCIALCCHHLVTWGDYVAQDWFRDELGWGEADFERVRKACSWGMLLSLTHTHARTHPHKHMHTLQTHTTSATRLPSPHRCPPPSYIWPNMH